MKKLSIWLTTAVLALMMGVTSVGAEEVSTSVTEKTQEQTTAAATEPTKKQEETTKEAVTQKPTETTSKEQASTEKTTKAETGNISVSAEDGAAGSNVKVTIKVTGTGLSTVNVALTFDSSKLKVASCSGGSLTGSNNLVITSSDSTSASATVVFTISETAKTKEAINVGATASFSNGKTAFNQDSIIVKDANSDATTSEEKTTSYSGSVSRDPERDDATIKSITVTGYKLSPAFNKDTKNYTLTVPNSVSSITVTAEPVDKTATCRVTGAKNLSVGENSVKVICTAEDGETKVYTITVTREAKPGSDEKVTEKQTEKVTEPVTQAQTSNTVVKKTGVPMWVAFLLCVVFMGIGFGMSYIIFVGFNKK